MKTAKSGAKKMGWDYEQGFNWKALRLQGKRGEIEPSHLLDPSGPLLNMVS